MILFLRRYLSNLRQSAVDPKVWFGALLWGVIWAFSHYVSFIESGWILADGLTTPLFILTLAGAVAALLTIPLARLTTPPFKPVWRYAAITTTLIITSVGASATFLALPFMAYFGQWHGDFGSLLWLKQTVWTSIAGLVLYAINGLRAAFPYAILSALTFGFALSRGWFASSR